MSSSGFSGIRAVVAVGALLIVGGIARADSGDQDKRLADFARFEGVSDSGWHPLAERRHHSARHLRNGRRVLAHHRIGKPHPGVATERPALVVADNMGPAASPLARPVAAASYCSDGITWNLLCPGAQVIGVSY